MNMPGMQMHDGATVQRTGTAGQYRAKVKADMAGDWTAKLSYEGPRGERANQFQLKRQTMKAIKYWSRLLKAQKSNRSPP